MRRRDLLLLAGGAAVWWPNSLLAQQAGKTVRIGVLGWNRANPVMSPAYHSLLEELRRLGFSEGQNLTVEGRPSDQGMPALVAAAKELVALKVDVLVALGTEFTLKAALAATQQVPIVFVANNYDPIALGYVKGLAKPGGNATGIFLRQTELAEKQVELLSEAFPDRRRLAVLWETVSGDQFVFAERRAKLLGLQVRSQKMENPPYDFEAAFRAIAETDQQMLLVLSSPLFGQQTQLITELAIQNRLPSMFIFKAYTLNGGLMSYGADNVAMYGQSAAFIAKVLHGAKPADLPVEQPTKFEFAVNLKTAKAIGVELPTSILLRANDVIE